MQMCRVFWCAATLAGALAFGPVLARPAGAQAVGSVGGTVTDSVSGAGLAGVQVTLVGSTRGGMTDANGVYLVRNVPPGNVIVRVQRLGFAAGQREVTVAPGATARADFALSPVATVLSAVVSVGYGSSRREDVTSAIASVSAADIAGSPSAGLDAALQGKAPGVQVLQNAGNPGNGISIRVRGPASINAGNQPLYVVDGVPILQENYSQLGLGGQDVTAVTGINPDDIETIDVLKDAAAASIYGSRGSNGVVLITTRRGASGSSRIAFNAYTGTQRAPSPIGLLNAQQYVQLYNESAKNDDYDEEDWPFVAGKDDARSYDWQGAVFRQAPISDVQLSASGGGDRVQYFLSGSYFDQQGVVIGSGYDRSSARLNLDFAANDRLSLRTSIAASKENNQRIEGDGSLDGIVTNAIGMQPMRPIYRDDGSFAGRKEGLRYSNPTALAKLNSTTLSTQRMLGNVEAEYSFTDRVRLTGRAGADILSLDESQWQSPLVDRTYAQSASGVGKVGHTGANKYLLESFLSYDALRSERSTLSIVAGASTERNDSELSFVRGEGFTSGFTKYVRNAANVTSYDGSATEHNLVSFFSRANMSYDNRYLFSLSARSDGSSRFGEDNRYGVFPAASIGWNVSNESFAEGLSRLGTLKLRVSYGLTGNEGIGDFAALGLAAGAPYAGTPGIAATTFANPDLRWETTRELDTGLDLSLFGGRATIMADYYDRQTEDLLVRRPIPMTSGFSSIWDNIGTIRNRGVDLGLNTVNINPASDNGFRWSSDLNVTFNRNKVESLYHDQQFVSGINGRETSLVTVGQPIGVFYMYRFDGVDPATGDAIIHDVDGDGDITSADRTVVGSPHPDYFGGFTNTFSLGVLELRTFLDFSQGNDVFNMMRIFTDDGGCTWDNLTTLVLNRWQKPGDITDVPRMSYDCTSGADLISSRFIEDGSYVRLGEVTLGLRLPASWAARAGMESARVYISGRNLKTWTDYSGYNPAVNSAGSDANMVMGTDYYAYPLARTFTFGISAGW